MPTPHDHCWAARRSGIGQTLIRASTTSASRPDLPRWLFRGPRCQSLELAMLAACRRLPTLRGVPARVLPVPSRRGSGPAATAAACESVSGFPRTLVAARSASWTAARGHDLFIHALAATPACGDRDRQGPHVEPLQKLASSSASRVASPSLVTRAGSRTSTPRWTFSSSPPPVPITRTRDRGGRRCGIPTVRRTCPASDLIERASPVTCTRRTCRGAACGLLRGLTIRPESGGRAAAAPRRARCEPRSASPPRPLSSIDLSRLHVVSRI